MPRHWVELSRARVNEIAQSDELAGEFRAWLDALEPDPREDKWSVHSGRFFCFKAQADALLFKLTWSG